MIITRQEFEKYRLAEGGYDTYMLYKLITRHMGSYSRYMNLLNYYLGRHDILQRQKSTASASNCKIVANHATYIVDMMVSYLVGNELQYTASKGVNIEAVENEYYNQDIAEVDSEIVKGMSIYGRAYELIYADEAAAVRSAVLDPKSVFVVYDDTVKEQPLFAVSYYKRYDIDGNIIGTVCTVYDDENIWTYEGSGDSFSGMELKDEELHYFGAVPVIEYRNNYEMQGDFEQIIPLIDAYNVLMSDRVDDKADFVDAFLFLRNIEIDSEQAKKLRVEKILMSTDESGTAQYLSKILTESDIKVLRDDIKEDIHRFSMVPALTDKDFGNNLSGVAIKYKLMGFEQAVKNKEPLLRKKLKHRFEIYNNFLVLKKNAPKVEIKDIDVVFTRNLPVNDLETAQMLNYLGDSVSNKTKLEQLSFVKNAKEEQGFVDEEQKKKYLEKISEYNDKIKATEGIAAGGGYNGDSYGRY